MRRRIRDIRPNLGVIHVRASFLRRHRSTRLGLQIYSCGLQILLRLRVITSTMANPASQPLTATPSSRASPPVAGNNSHDMVNGHGDLHEAPITNAAPPAASTKKGKKKVPDPNETGKLLAAKINQLELDAAGEKDQEAEIGMSRPHQFRG